MNRVRPVVLLADRDIALLQREKAARASGLPQPMNIRLLLDEISEGGAQAMSLTKKTNNTIAFVYHFDRAIVAHAALRRPFTFLVWGLPHRGFFRDAIARFVLRRASLLLANDPDSAEETLQWSGRAPLMVPYFIDTDFFVVENDGPPREDFLFCPSSNGRDPELLCALAERGARVVWLNNDAALTARYANRVPTLTIVTRPDFNELRTLYQTCRACILPVNDARHAAGQTTALEALACGAPVFITQSRTSAIFREEGLVTILPSNDAQKWELALKKQDMPDAWRRRRRAVEEGYSVERCRRMFSELLFSPVTRS